MSKTTARGISYAESSDGPSIPSQLQGQATTLDTALGVVEAEITALDTAEPFATANVTVTISGSGAGSYSQAFTWPVSRFTQAPATMITNNGGTGSSNYYIACSGAPTTSGGTVQAFHRDGTTATLTALVVHITGIQMTSGSGFG